MKEWILTALAFYVAFSLMIAFFRLLPMDCEVRYVDYLFPLSRMHCPVGGK